MGMTYIETLEIVKNIVSSKVEGVELNEDTILSELGLDSLDVVEITLEVEDKFHIEFTSSEISDLLSLKDVCELIRRKSK